MGDAVEISSEVRVHHLGMPRPEQPLDLANGVQGAAFRAILPWHRRSSYEPDAPARGVPQSPRWRVGLVCARMRNFLAGVIVLLYLQVLSWFFNGGNMLRER